MDQIAFLDAQLDHAHEGVVQERLGDEAPDELVALLDARLELRAVLLVVDVHVDRFAHRFDELLEELGDVLLAAHDQGL